MFIKWATDRYLGFDCLQEADQEPYQRKIYELIVYFDGKKPFTASNRSIGRDSSSIL